MCDLCRIDVDGRTVCPGCFDRLAMSDELESTRTTFRDYGGMALVSALFGLFFVALFVWVVFAPLSIYYGIKGMQQKKKLGETDGRLRIWISMTLALTDIVLGLFMARAMLT